MKQRDDVAGMPLFEQPNWAESYTPEHRNRDIERLVPLARELAERAGHAGIRVENIRIAAVQRGLLTGAEQGRRLSFLGALPKRAGLVNTGRYERNKTLRKTHGSLGAVWVLPQFSERTEGAA